LTCAHLADSIEKDSYFEQLTQAPIERGLVHLVYLVGLVFLVYLVCLAA
jgi:hypothetical protein